MDRSHRIRNGTLIALALVVVPAAIVFSIETFGPRPPAKPATTSAPAPAAGSEDPTPANNDIADTEGSSGTAIAGPARPPRQPAVVVRSPDPGRSPLADQLNAPEGNIQADLAILVRILDNYRTEVGGNPVGNNREITAQLSGENSRRHAPLPGDHSAIDQDGQLRDRWGTPFFFHAISALQMEIRSAGPDRERYSADDVIWSPRPPSAEAP